MYVGLIGEQGGGKTYAKDKAREIQLLAFPPGSPQEIPLGASVTTAPAICQYLGSDEATRIFTNENGTIIDYRPLTFYINELKNFLTNNPAGMINFLTDTYDTEYFKNETKNKGSDFIERPFITLLACETPEWIIQNLKGQIITGGFSRRLITVYELERGIIPLPKYTQEMKDAKARVVAHLQRIKPIAGQFQWTPQAEVWWEKWYVHNRMNLPKDDPIMRGYKLTKDVLLMKTAMLLGMTDYSIVKEKLLFTPEGFEVALATLNAIEPNMPKLSMASGRNPLAGPQQKILDLLDANEGMLPEKILQKSLDKELSPMEQMSVIRHLVDTDRIVKKSLMIGLAKRVMLITKTRYEKAVASGEIKDWEKS